MSRVQGVRYWKAEELEYKTMRQGLFSLLSTFDRLQVQQAHLLPSGWWSAKPTSFGRIEAMMGEILESEKLFSFTIFDRMMTQWRPNDLLEKILAATPIFRKQLMYDLVYWPGVQLQGNRQTEKTWADRRDSVYIQFPSFSPNFRCTVFICTTHVYLNCTI